MRSPSLVVTAITMLLLGAACGDDSAATGSGGGDATSSATGDAPTTSGSPASTTTGTPSSTGPGAGGEGGADPSTTSAGNGGGGAGGEGTGTGTGGAGGGPAATAFGRVLFANGYYGVDPVVVEGSVNATFAEIVEPGDPNGCVETLEGDCTLILCPPFDGDPPTTEPRLAGDLTVDGTRIEAPLTYDDAYDYYGFYAGEHIYDAGDELSVEATGDEVPAFTGSVVAPAHATLTSPTDADLTFSLDEDLEVTWDVEGNGGRLLAYLAVYEEDGSSAAIYCDWPIDDGAASMPSALVGELPPTSAGFLDLYDFSATSVEVDQWVIEIAAQGATQADTKSGTASFSGIVLE